MRAFRGFVIGFGLAAGLGVAALWHTARRQGTPWPPEWVAEAIARERPAKPSEMPGVREQAPGGIRSAAGEPAAGLAARSWGAGFRRRDGWTGERQTRYTQQWALIIGVDAYERARDLEFAYNDAREVRDVLTEFGYDEAHTLFLSAVHPERDSAGKDAKAPDLQPGEKAVPAETGANRELAVAAGLRRALFAPDGWLAQLTDGKPENGEMGRNDAFLMVYAGHGDQRVDGAGFLVPCDGDPARPETCIFLTQPRDLTEVPNLKSRLAALPCKHKGLILDACFAGAVFAEPAKAVQAGARSAGGTGPEGTRQLGRGAGTAFRDEDAIAFYFREKAFLGLVAGRATPVADGGGEDRHSVFTHNLLDVLRKRADTARPDHSFTFRQMAMLVEGQVGQEGKNVGQVPRSGYLDAGGEGDLIFRETELKQTPREQRLAEQGRKWLEIAENQPLPHKQIFAAKALGFLGYGRRPEGLEERIFRIESPVCFDERFHREDIARAKRLIEGEEGNGLEFRPKVFWSSPAVRLHYGLIARVAFSPDGARLASGSEDGTVRFWEVATGKQVGEPLAGHRGSVTSVAFSPDGARLASAGRDGTVRLWEVATGQQVGEPLAGHERVVASVAFSPDGARLASGSGDGAIRLWDAATGQPLGEPPAGHEDWVTSVAFSPDGARLASGSWDKTVRLWDVASGQPLGEPLVGHEGGVTSVAFSPDGVRLASGSGDKTVRLWDVASGQPLGEPLVGHEGGVYSVVFRPDGARLASAGEDGTVRLWEVATGQPLGKPLKGHEKWGAIVAFSPDGARLASAGEVGTIRLWEVATGKQVGEPRAGHEGGVTSVAFSPDGVRLASGSEDGTVRLWEVASGQQVGEPLAGHEGGVTSVAFSPDGVRLASGSEDGTVRFWEVATGKQVGEPLAGHAGGVTSVAFSPDGARLASAGDDNTVRLWEVASGQQVGEPLKGHAGRVTSVAFSPDGAWLASGSWDNTRLWEVASGQQVSEPLKGHEGWVTSLAFSPDGARLASGSEDRTVRLWDAATCLPLRESLAGHEDWVYNVTFSPDGVRLASGSEDKTVRLWDLATGKQVGEPLKGHGDRVNSVAFSPDGARLASGSWDRTVRLWDAASGQPLGKPLVGHEGWVYSVVFSPDGVRLASGSGDKTVRLWDVANCKQVGEPFKGHVEAVTSVAFSPDGARLASGSLDRTVRLWDVASGKQVGVSLTGHENFVTSVVFSPDGTRLASGSWDRTVRLWDVASGKQVGEPFAGHGDQVTSVAFSPNGARLASGSEDQTIRLWDAATGMQLGEPLVGHEGWVYSVAFSPDGTRLASSSRDMTVRLWEAEPSMPEGGYVLDLARYFRDGWIEMGVSNRGLVWQYPLANQLFQGHDFGFRIDVVSRGSITHLLRDTQDAPDRNRRLFQYYLDRRWWKPAWIWWERMFEKQAEAASEWDSLTPETQAELAGRLFTSLYALSARKQTDAPPGWYELRLQGIWEDHRDRVTPALNGFGEWRLTSFVKGIAGRDQLCGMEELALTSLAILRQKARAAGRAEEPAWREWETALHARPEGNQASPAPIP